MLYSFLSLTTFVLLFSSDTHLLTISILSHLYGAKCLLTYLYNSKLLNLIIGGVISNLGFLFINLLLYS